MERLPSSQCTSKLTSKQSWARKGWLGQEKLSINRILHRGRENKQTGSALGRTMVGTVALGKSHNWFTMCLLQSSKWLHLGLVFLVSLLPPQCYLPHFHGPPLLFFFIFQPVNADHLLNPVPGPPLFHAQFWAHLGEVTSFLLDSL